MQKFLRSASAVLLIISIFTGCKKDKPVDEFPEETNFVSATSVGTFSKSDLQALAVKGGFGAFAPLAKYDVEYYKIVYRTTFKGNSIQVSGLLGLPKNTTSTPSLISAQHGTMFRYADAPSNFPGTFSGFELFASAGFIDLIPDFIGYGVSQQIAHPYYDQASSGLTVVDMVKATKYWLKKQSVNFSPRLFLIGYSEGGYVTMAAQKEIETNATHQLSVTGAAMGAGGYDLTTFLNIIASTATYASPSFLTLLLKGYNNTYNYNRPYSDFFAEPYASRIPALVDGTKTKEQIEPQLTTSTVALFNPAFYAALADPTKETVLKQQLTVNSFLSWVPKSPTQLYHGTADESVPFATSVSTYAKFQAAGATNVQFFPVPGGTHGTALQPMMLNALPWILSLDK